MSRARVMDDFKKTSLRAMNGQCLGILVNDTNMSGLCSAQHVIFIEMTYKKKKNTGFIFVISGLTKIVGGRSHFSRLNEKRKNSSARLRGIRS